MRHHYLPNHKHQIVHPNPRPLPPSPSQPHRPIPPLSQFNSHFPRALKKQPHKIALLQAHFSPGHILRLEKHKRQYEFRAAHSLVRRQVLLPQHLFQQCFFRERGFCLRFGLHSDGAGGFEALFHERGVVFVGLRCCRGVSSGERFRFHALLLLLSIFFGFIFVAERQSDFLHAALLALFEAGCFGCLLTVLGSLVSIPVLFSFESQVSQEQEL